jgi:hypothetical protein
MIFSAGCGSCEARKVSRLCYLSVGNNSITVAFIWLKLFIIRYIDLPELLGQVYVRICASASSTWTTVSISGNCTHDCLSKHHVTSLIIMQLGGSFDCSRRWLRLYDESYEGMHDICCRRIWPIGYIHRNDRLRYVFVCRVKVVT